jgi:hypothetical protein
VFFFVSSVNKSFFDLQDQIRHSYIAIGEMHFFGKAPNRSVILLALVVCCSGSDTGVVPSLTVLTAATGEVIRLKRICNF